MNFKTILKNNLETYKINQIEKIDELGNFSFIPSYTDIDYNMFEGKIVDEGIVLCEYSNYYDTNSYDGTIVHKTSVIVRNVNSISFVATNYTYSSLNDSNIKSKVAKNSMKKIFNNYDKIVRMINEGIEKDLIKDVFNIEILKIDNEKVYK